MEDLNDKITGSTLSSTEWNQVPSELQNVIESTGQSLTSSDLNQLGKGIATYASNGDFYTDSGAANAYVLSPVGSKQVPTTYSDGQRIRFFAANPNAVGASTLNAGGVGVISIFLPDGATNPGAGQISGLVECVYSASAGAAILDVSGQFNTTVITASGAYIPPVGVKSIKFTVIGGGGGGGGTQSTNASEACAASGGGAGGVSIITITNIETSYTVTIGAGGAGAPAGNNDGNAGGTTSVVSAALNLVSTGGSQGLGMPRTTGSDSKGGGTSGSGSGGDLNLFGGDGDNSKVDGGEPVAYGDGGESFLGGGVRSPTNSNGNNGRDFGNGGTGAVSGPNSGAGRTGGDGADGVVIVEERF